MSDNGNSKLPLIIDPAQPQQEERLKSPIILPDAGSKEVLPASYLSQKLKLDDATLAQLGVKSEADLGDDFELERSPHDGACVVTPLFNGMPGCWYCGLPFARGIPEYEPAEIQIAKASGMEQGLRAKVHGSCHVRKMQEIASGK